MFDKPVEGVVLSLICVMSFTASPRRLSLFTVTARRRPRQGTPAMVEHKCRVNKKKPSCGVFERPVRIDLSVDEPVRRHTRRACLHVAAAITACRAEDGYGSEGRGRGRMPRETRAGYICPSLRRVSIPRPSSCARPARSALVVIRNSVMICGMVAAQEGTVPVHGTQPRLR